MLARYNRAGLFSIFHESEQISLINVTAYSSPSTFISGNHNSAINVIDSQAVVKPGRLKSINADAVHIQSNRIGAWIENSSFDGVSDDIANFYTTPFTPLSQSADLRTFVFANVPFRGGESQDPGFAFASSFKLGDHLTFYQTATGEILGEARIESVQYNEIGNRTVGVTLDQPMFGVSIETPGSGNGDDNYLNNTTVYNNELASGFLIQDSVFSNARRHGVYLMAHRTQIVDSIFEGISDQAIAGHNETGWPLGLFASDVLIQNNEFVNNGFSLPYQSDPQYAGVVAFNMDRYADRKLVDRTETPYRNIRILDNLFDQWSKSAISIRNAREVVISDNVFRAAGPHGASDVENFGRNTAIRIAWSKDVELDSNRAVDLGLNAGFDEKLADASVEVRGLRESDSARFLRMDWSSEFGLTILCRDQSSHRRRQLRQFGRWQAMRTVARFSMASRTKRFCLTDRPSARSGREPLPFGSTSAMRRLTGGSRLCLKTGASTPVPTFMFLAAGFISAAGIRRQEKPVG